MKVVIYREKATNKIIRESDDYNRLKNNGETDEQIEERIQQFNSRQENVISEIIELDEVAQFYREKKENERAQQIGALEDMKYDLTELAAQIDEYIRNAKRHINGSE